ncbi:hypothetical protein [Streptomyces dangxiongensis]|uniref:hypothetical protein n=1 Tax=Streptomyces dangxiongensis TaxID=1442032 RepID=UPI001969D73A|nr:hypothetical protein [Streptomyces dangxiongensis]
MDVRRRRRTARAEMSGRRVLLVQAALAGGLAAALFVKEFPGLVREVRIYRMTGGLRARRRYP